ncbi:carbohydrate ABC transporter permease [Streptomyces sp. TS71-3]|uniref:carbohydrate ABC transporter permease n=1 Tax=Streptomyces sp. TS71-3 TaxID=2733862 RepID=UPI001B1B637A|nr:carbohydrate ABC transporter permease [Streptomyces sp. TS71-3]GHJ36722.1 sugar ABC transporter permease [Streptomyces sp. TS71-3]
MTADAITRTPHDGSRPGAPGAGRTRHAGAPAGRGRKALTYTVLILLALAFVVPLVWMVSSSLKPENQIMQVPPNPVPTHPQWDTYAKAGRTVWPFFLNSCKLAALNVVFLLLFASLAAYGFARLKFAGKRIAFAMLLATAMIPSMVYLIPQYILYRHIGWIDTQYPLLIPRVLTPVFGTFLLRQAFKQVPGELEDAALIDGAGRFTIYWRIMLPQVKPALAAVGVLTFMESWNDLFGPLIFINSPSIQTLPVALAMFQGEYFSQTNLMMAAATVSVIPPLVLFLMAQRYFVKGVTMSGLKG